MTLNLFLIAILIVATAFFVATEFAIIKLRPSRIDQLVMEGNKKALSVKKVTMNLDGYLSACQLGITITALGLGWLGEPTVHAMLLPVFQAMGLPAQVVGIVSFIIAFFLITFLHVVVGELAPKSVAIQKAEAISLLTARPIIFFYRIMYPLIWLLNGAAMGIIRLAGLKPVTEHEEAHSEEELRIILTESYRSGKINQAEYGYVNRIFEFDDRLAREVMVPRTDMVCLFRDQPLEEQLRVIKEEKYTRFPVATESKDHIVGMINTKEFFLEYADNPNLNLADLIHPVLFVQESMPIKTLLKEMQKQRGLIAILLDEYGGTSGMVTTEDILEEIVGEIRDEFDEEECVEIEKIDENHIVVDGKVLLTDISDLFDVDLESEDIDTVGGLVYSRVPAVKEGSEWTYKDLTFVVREKDQHRIRRLDIIRRPRRSAD